MKHLLIFLATLVAPVVTLFYRKGIWLTPDDTVSPYGQYEPTMQKIYAKWGKFIGDWWWLGIRNTAYGLQYKFKPQILKVREGGVYRSLKMDRWEHGSKRVIRLFGHDKTYTEYFYSFKYFHVIYGYRLRPVHDQMTQDTPVKRFSMDGRPIFSIRFGNKDD